ncbi:MAG: histidine phosphatase family protein [Planctomycetota bacterium]|nr:MAG: histidine phosphatase family protein [Planctomycetota bacterium]
MERRLIVLRHAKSSWSTGAPDRERPLNARGRRDAPRVGRALAEQGWIPEQVLCSDALRARETWARMCAAFDPTPRHRCLPELYLAGPAEVGPLLEDLPDELGCALIVGHNDGWERVVEWLTGIEIRLTTCNAALLRVAAKDWAGAVARAPGWELAGVLRPKEL